MRKGKVRESRFQEKYDPRKLADRFSWSWREKTELGERKSAARRGRFVVGVSEACPLCGGRRELGKGEKEAAGARSDFGGRGVVRAAGATPCSFCHHSQSGPHPHLQYRTVLARTVENIRPLSSSCATKCKDTHTPPPSPAIAGSLATGALHLAVRTGSYLPAFTSLALLAASRDCPALPCLSSWRGLD